MNGYSVVSAAPAPAAARTKADKARRTGNAQLKAMFKTLSGTQVEQTSRDEASLLNQIRAHRTRFEPTWLLQAQRALGVSDATGAMNTETLRALRERKGGSIGLDDLHDEGFLQAIVAGEPFVEILGFEHEQKNTSATHPADKAAQAAGYADYESYKVDMTSTTFLGVSLKQGKSDVGLIHSRGHTTRGGYSGEDGNERARRAARAPAVHG